MVEAPDKPHRHWLSFSLRSLLLLIAMAGIWFGPIANRAKKQIRAVEAITKWGGSVRYDYESDGLEQPAYPAWLRNFLPPDYLRTVKTVHLAKSQITDDDFQILTGLPELVSLDLEDTKITDTSIRQLGRLTKLKVLILNGTDCTDQGFQSLKSLTNMRQLGLSRTQISDEGLVTVRTMPFLSMLDISGTRIGDLGLAHLRGLNLNSLNVSGTEITEAGLLQLQQLPELDYLFVSRRLITPAGIRGLQGLPKLKTLVFELEQTDDWAKLHAELKQALPGVGVVPQMFPERRND